MAWVRIDDQFTDHPKAAHAGPLGIAMQVAGLCYCNRYLTDGFIPLAIAPRLLDFTGIAEGEPHDVDTKQVNGYAMEWMYVVERLEKAGMWEVVDGGWLIHDYLEYNPSREEMQAKRAEVSEKRAEAGRRGAAARWQNGKTDGKTDGNRIAKSSKPMANEWQNDGPNPNPNPKEKEPRDARLPDEPAEMPIVESIAQLTGEQPFDVLASFADVIGTDLGSVAPAWKKKQLAAAKRLLEEGYGTDKVRRYILYRLSETWRNGSTFDLFSVEKEIGTWEAHGSPERAATNGIRPSQADHNRGGTGKVVY
jgi:hypothetical protein